MAYKVKVTFAEGITQDQLHQAMEKMGVSKTNPPQGGISHDEAIEDGQVIFTEEWESKAAFENFISQTANPVMNEDGIPPPEVEEL